jgi:glycosyltransferase involved in cell wall biosynthesis
MKLRIGIAGTRGIPNQYGGFEQFAAYLSKGLVERGHDVTVYNTHNHPYHNKEWNGVNIVHCPDPEYLGTAGQFVYDLRCILDARNRNFDIFLLLGYTSSSVWGKLYPGKPVVITNMDGMEWKRSKYTKPVQAFLRYAEKLAVKFSNCHIADSVAIKKYLEDKYEIPVDFISYGSEFPSSIDEKMLAQFGVEKNEYHLLIARMEPENNIEVILDGLCKRDDTKKILVIGNTGNRFGQKMKNKFADYPLVVFAGTVYDRAALDALRANCFLYFHGHSVGGTNPSLLEAMACGALICAHDNVFNRAVLNDHAYWFKDAGDIAEVKIETSKTSLIINANLEKIRNDHSWEKIVVQYEDLFMKAYQSSRL